MGILKDIFRITTEAERAEQESYKKESIKQATERGKERAKKDYKEE